MPSSKLKKKTGKKRLRKRTSTNNKPCKIEQPIPRPINNTCTVSSKKKTPFIVRKINSADKAGVKRLLSPFPANRPSTLQKKTKPTYPTNGLSPKEKAYVICSFQSKISRYINLKNLAKSVMRENKVFTIYGVSTPIRKALMERGWIEKFPPNKMSLKAVQNQKNNSKSKINYELERLMLSNLMEKHNANFIWFTVEEAKPNVIDMFSDATQTIINKLKMDSVWTSKQGLCSSIKDSQWFYIENVSEINTPRTYISSDQDEIYEFINDYRFTACTSLLKWTLTMVENKRPIFDDNGSTTLNVFVFALNRCKEFLIRKINKDIDRTLPEISSSQWNTFLSKSLNVMSGNSVFKFDTDDKCKIFLGYAKFLLKQLWKFRPQLCCEGCRNVWILKPTNLCRGRGIRMAAEYDLICSFIKKTNTKYVIQKYIEDPLLIHETKFDIRQYYLVTSTCPLIIWMYKDCYLKFSSQKYDLEDFHESIHLTNNAVQKKYKNCPDRHVELPVHNMWHSDLYKEYLENIGKSYVWDNIVYVEMKKSIIATMLSCQDYLYPSKNRFELYGCDFILDRQYKPWLIEVNSRPDLKSTTPVTSVICPAVLDDIIKVVIDRAKNPKAPIGRFECIYRQPMTSPRLTASVDLVVKGHALPYNYFYKGKVETQESFDDPFIGKRLDCDSDIMMETERSSDDKEDEKSVSPPNEETDKSSTDPELKEEAAVIMSQLTDLLSRIPSHSNEAKSVLPLRSIKSLTHIAKDRKI